jgi:protein-L-isoaspartate(D-aspartate) O-methyltransferase
MRALDDILTRLELQDRPHARAALRRQVEATGASDRIVEAIASVPRHAFVPAELAPLAYAPSGLWLPSGAVLPSPELTARILSALDLQPTERVLEHGTGCGYLTVVLSQLAKEVVTVDNSHRSDGALEVAQIPNLKRGGATEGAFDAVLVTMPQAIFSPALLGGAPRGVVVIGPPFGTQRLLLARAHKTDAMPDLFDLGPVLFPASTLAYAPVSIPPPPPGWPVPREGEGA